MNPHAAALLYILAADGPTTGDDLAAALSIGRRSVSRQIALLTARGLIDAHKGPRDGEGVIPWRYFATPAGMALAAAEQVPT